MLYLADFLTRGYKKTHSVRYRINSDTLCARGHGAPLLALELKGVVLANTAIIPELFLILFRCYYSLNYVSIIISCLLSIKSRFCTPSCSIPSVSVSIIVFVSSGISVQSIGVDPCKLGGGILSFIPK